MPSFNKVIIMGNLTVPPEVRYTNSGTAICNIHVAINRKFKNTAGESKEEVCFTGVVIFGKMAESAGTHLRKGSAVLVEGRLKSEQWEDKQSGQKRTRVLVNAESVTFMDGPPEKKDESKPSQEPKTRIDDEDVPGANGKIPF